MADAKVRGRVIITTLDKVRPNDWNPNKLTLEQKRSLRHGLEADGWLVSQALLVWGEDEKKRVRNLIIDGEHRWEEARALGFVEGPMVFLNGLSEVEAKQLTIKMDAKRGQFDQDRLGTVLRSLQVDLGVNDLALELGFSNEELLGHLSISPELVRGKSNKGGGPARPPPAGPPVVSSNPHTTMVPLFFNAETHAEFQQLAAKLGPRFGSDNLTDTVLAALRDQSD